MNSYNDVQFITPKQFIKNTNISNTKGNTNSTKITNRYELLQNDKRYRNTSNDDWDQVDDCNSTTRENKDNNKKNRTTVPGNTSYANIAKRGKNIALFGDSIISDIKRKEFNKHIKGNVQIKSFNGATTKDMDVYVQPTLDKKMVDIAVIHVGTNDI